MSGFPELTRPLALERIGAGLTMVVEADAGECAAIAARLLVPSVEQLQCTWTLTHSPGGVVEAEGSLAAQLHQTCVVTLEPFAVTLADDFRVCFVPRGQESEEADDPDVPDELPYDGGALDLGEATVEQLALSLDPYPRQPGAVLPDGAGDGAADPFAALAKWRSTPQ